MLCQITSNPYADPRAVKLEDADFETGSLRVESYLRPGKLFTASDTLLTSQVGRLKPASLSHVVDAVIALLRRGIAEDDLSHR
ncbi:MAG TPA: type II toxin-antitoxin system PemK/MazF family toxin [Thermoanaerobaculia bacterium]|nr:type II toxin-antitoxin system PemK/MazF family toxin [Thermoanaerobaculia bacterium]